MLYGKKLSTDLIDIEILALKAVLEASLPIFVENNGSAFDTKDIKFLEATFSRHGSMEKTVTVSSNNKEIPFEEVAILNIADAYVREIIFSVIIPLLKESRIRGDYDRLYGLYSVTEDPLCPSIRFFGANGPLLKGITPLP